MWTVQENRQYKNIVKVDGVDYSENIVNLTFEYDLDGSSGSSIFGSVLIYNIELEIFGDVKGESVDISFGYYTGDYVDEPSYHIEDMGNFKISEYDYDEKLDVTKIKAETDISPLDDEFSLQDISGKTTNELLENSLNDGENIVLPKVDLPIKDISDKYYSRRLDLYQDIAKLTGTYLEISNKERNLIPNGWESFEPYGSGENLLDSNNIGKYMYAEGGSNAKVTISYAQHFREADTNNAIRVTSVNSNTNKQIRIRQRHPNVEIELTERITIKNIGSGEIKLWTGLLGSNNIKPGETVDVSNTKLNLYNDMLNGYIENVGEVQDIDILFFRHEVYLPGDAPLTVEKTPLENGLTRIQTWGGNSILKLSSPILSSSVPNGTSITYSLYIENKGTESVWVFPNTFSGDWKQEVKQGFKGKVSFTVDKVNASRLSIQSGVRYNPSESNINANLDFIASDPKITDHKLEYTYEFKEIESTGTRLPVFELDLGDSLKPIDTVDMRWHHGDNVAVGDGNSLIVLDNVELVKDTREELSEQILSVYKGFTHQSLSFKSPSHPFVGGKVILDSADGEVEALITKVQFDAKTWTGQYESDIIDVDEVHTNYVGYYDRRLNNTEIVVNKVNNEIEIVTEQQSETEDRVSKLTVDLEGIQSQVESLNTNANVIINLSNTLGDYTYWEWENTPLLKYYQGLVYLEGLKYGTNYQVVELDKSLARWGQSFFAKGIALSTYGFVIPDTVYSFRVRRYSGKHSFKVHIREYDKDLKLLKSTPYTMNGKDYETLTMQPAQMTMYIRVGLEVPTATYSSRLVLTEHMFNRGMPAEWADSPEAVKIWAQSQIEQLDDKIGISVDKIDNLSHDIHNTTVDISADKGVEIWSTSGKGLTVYGPDGSQTFGLTTSGDIDMVGNLKAGSVGEFIIDDGIKSKDGLFILDPVNKVIKNDNIRLTSSYYDAGGFKGVNSFKVTGDDGLPTMMSIDSTEFSTFNVEAHGKRVALYAGKLYSSVSADQGTFNALTINHTATVEHMDIKHINVRDELFVQHGLKMTGPMTSSAVFTNAVYPRESNPTLGTDSNRWGNIYLVRSPNVSSDRRIKKSIKDIPQDLIEHMVRLKPKQYIQEGEVHFGYVAQDVERELYKYCVDKYGWENAQLAMDRYAFIHKSESYLSLLYGEINVLKDAYYMNKISELERELSKKPKVSKGFRKRSGK